MRCRLWLTAFCSLLLINSSAQTDSIIRAFDTAQSDETRGRLAAKISVLLSDFDEAKSIDWARRGYAFVGNRNVAAAITCANQLGIWHKDHGRYDSAIYYYKIALEKARVLNIQRYINGELSNIGQTYGLTGKYAQALNYQLQSLNYYESSAEKNTPNHHIVAIAVANTYYHMHLPRKALEILLPFYPTLVTAKSSMAGGLLNTMALCYGALNDAKRETAFLNEALAFKRAKGDSASVANTLNNLGDAAYRRKDFVAAEDYYRQALQLHESLGMKAQSDETRQNIASAQAARGNPQAAIKQFKASLGRAKAEGNLRIQKLTLQNLIGVYDSLHDYASAYKYIAEYEGVADTAQNKDYIGAIADAETKYQTQKALRERDKASFESRLQADGRVRAIRERNTAVWLAVGSVVALMLIFGLMWRIRTIRARQREEGRATRAIFEGEQAERIRIARDLHDSIGQMLAVVKMRLTSAPAHDARALKEQTDASAALVDDVVAEVRAISHNLIPEDLTFGAIRAIENLCTRLAAAGNLTMELTVSEEVRSHQFNQQFSLSLYRIVQEVLGNMMKHSGATAISLSMLQAGGNIILELSDNGKGFDTSVISTSKGIGWKNVFARVRLLNGSVDVRSERISGTRIQISLPQ